MTGHDFTHCKGKQCTKKKSCYRYIAYRNYLDRKLDFPISFFMEIPFKNGECEFFTRSINEIN